MNNDQGFGMNRFSRGLLIGALILIVLNSSCNFPVATPPPVGTILPAESAATSSIPTSILNIPEATVGIPVTGPNNVVALQCEFCVNDEAHAVLTLPESASFLVSDPVVGISCLTAQVVNSQRIVLCRGAQQTSFTLNVCVDNSNCTQLPITLHTCPLLSQTGLLTPRTTFTPTIVVLAPQSTSPPNTATTVNTSTSIPPTPAPTQLSTQAPTQTGVPPALATATLSHPLQPTRPTAPPPGNGLQDPAELVRWYFNAVWTGRDYQTLWQNYLTPKFQTTVSPGGFPEYVQWWDSVDHVVMNSENVIQNNGTNAWVRVNVTFYLKDGRVLENRIYDYSLLYDPLRKTWMFD